MGEPDLKPIELVHGIEIGVSGDRRDKLLSLIRDMLKVAAALASSGVDAELGREADGRVMTIAASASTQTVNALLAAAIALCHLKHPPEDIELKQNAAGKLIYRCYHVPPHEFDVASGNQLP